ncbi:MAG: hypothetical protein K9M75_06420 [Phycisphaerae bacterium]|nr:hypothetical protein [Phycisphaerae bacterium]
MSRNIEPPKEEKAKVPTYIVTFSDMITLLLTFFVLLLSMATEQIDDAKFEKGRDALIDAMSNVGIKGISFSTKPTMGKVESTLHPVENNEKFTQEEALDATEEVVRRIFKELEKQMKITPAQITGKSPDFRPTSIKFKKDGAVLNESSMNYLKKFSFNLQENIGNQNLTVYVVGLAQDEKSLQKQCLVSAKRAQVAADFLRESLPEGLRWKIHSWGAGPGGQWKTNGPVEESQVVIAVLGN